MFKVYIIHVMSLGMQCNLVRYGVFVLRSKIQATVMVLYQTYHTLDAMCIKLNT
jgi:hypothetical protein